MAEDNNSSMQHEYNYGTVGDSEVDCSFTARKHLKQHRTQYQAKEQ